MNTWMSSWVNTLCACRLELTIQRAECIKTLDKCLMGEGHQVWAISASFLDCSKTQDSRVYGQKHLENWDFIFFLSKIGIVTFLKNFSKAKRIHMNDGKGHQVWAISIASFLDCSKTQDSRVYGQKHLENWDFFFF